MHEEDLLSYDRDYQLMMGNNHDFMGNANGQMLGIGALSASGPSSHRLQQSDNPYFLATNASIFDRNPFKDFTTNKLGEILAGKNSKEL